MVEFFSCGKNCHIADLGLLEWLAVILIFLVFFLLTVASKKWAFSRNKYQQNSFWWHAPRLIFFVVVLGVVTIPTIWLVLGSTAAFIYGKVIFPELAFVSYMFWYFTSSKV